MPLINYSIDRVEITSVSREVTPTNISDMCTYKGYFDFRGEYTSVSGVSYIIDTQRVPFTFYGKYVLDVYNLKDDALRDEMNVISSIG